MEFLPGFDWSYINSMKSPSTTYSRKIKLQLVVNHVFDKQIKIKQ